MSRRPRHTASNAVPRKLFKNRQMAFLKMARSCFNPKNPLCLLTGEGRYDVNFR